MKLEGVLISNFRCYRAAFYVPIDILTCIIAKNDAGKSTVLEALDAFFNLEKLDAEDRSIGARNADAIEITCFFSSIQATLILDSDALISPATEYLLNAQGQLEVTKKFTGATPKCEHVFVKALHPTAPRFNDLFDLSIAELRRRAQELNVDLQGVNQTIKSALRHAIWSSVPQADLELQEVAIEIKSTIWKPLQNALPLYQLFRSDRPSSDQDAEAQDPIKFAIREAIVGREAELNAIGAYVRDQVAAVTHATIEKLREMDPGLAAELNPVFSPFNWAKGFAVSLTGEGQIPLNKRGSGVRRLFLVNFFRAKAEQLANGRGAPDIILAIEEPETSQHPNNQLVLLEALIELSQSPSTQVLMTTHNPLIARRINQEQLRFIEINQNGERSLAPSSPDAVIRLRETLGVLPNHEVRVFVGVEGPNDIEFLNRISGILSATEQDIPNLQDAEANGKLIYIPMGGSTLELWTNRLQGLAVAEVHIMDRDNPPPQLPKYHEAAARVNARGGACMAYTTTCREMENLLHFEAIQEALNVNLGVIAAFDDVPTRVAEEIHAASGSPNAWVTLDAEKRSKKASNAKRRLNRDAVDRMTAERLTVSDVNDEVRSWLREIGQYLV
ncbi:ATP-binding protein [Herbaspirillum sp. B65]|uniref:ATP-binding protein n=1 Tax=Herbaspirillum sp. B65 TaxID=137708 RepID=UPI00034B01CD|nr:ATP-binding protein [Herbaspirillum sp. B65]